MLWVLLILSLCLIAMVLIPMYQAVEFYMSAELDSWFSMEWIPQLEQFGFGVSLLGTMAICVLAMPMIIAGGWLLAYQLVNEKQSVMKNLTLSIMQLWCSLPSVVIGVWAISQFVPSMRKLFDTSGYGLLTASLVLALYLVPVATMLFYSSYSQFEKSFSDLEESLKMNFWTKTRIFFLSCKSQIVHVVNYCFCRVFGETMLILMLSGNAARIPESIHDPVRTMTATFALEAPYATDLHEQALYGITGLCLILLLVVLLIGKLSDEK